MDFNLIYDRLNKEQKEAVDQIDGPLLVLAGPGTGKTQLLSARVANILLKTDTLPENILCLTFTENGANNMRERLNSFIGQDSYKVNISTYHGFGHSLIVNNSDYIDERSLEKPIDNIKSHRIISQIRDSLQYGDPLKRTSISDIKQAINEVKQGLLTSDDLRAISEQNINNENLVNADLKLIFKNFVRMPKKDAAINIFSEVLASLEKNIKPENKYKTISNNLEIYRDELAKSIDEAIGTGTTKSITAWKNKFLKKNKKNTFILAGNISNKKIQSLANILDSYQQLLEKEGLFDYSDMILEAIKALENNDDLRFSLQERYLYILLDEYQDTNPAQSRIVELLTNNPVTEGRPNVMAVGDDDQAIYAFQGAMSSNLKNFFSRYNDTKIINLSKNYRSSADILHLASNVIKQLEDRFSDSFSNITKKLTAEISEKDSCIKRLEFKSFITESSWVSNKISELLKSGVDPKEIAILAPKHKYLEGILPFLHKNEIPISYEKRENILESPIISQITTISELITKLVDNPTEANELWPQALSFDFFKIEPLDIWQLTWDANLQRKQIAEVVLNSPCEKIKNAGSLMLKLSLLVKNETLEKMIDFIVGNEPVGEGIISPLKNYYLSRDDRTAYQVISHLTVIREHLRSYYGNSPTRLQSLLSFIDDCNEAEVKIMNTNPYNESESAVNVMTVFAAKGLEFKYVFLISADDYTWATAKGNDNKLSLPINLKHIRHTGATIDEKLRLLFVAITRAKSYLYITNSVSDFTGKNRNRLRFLDEREQDGIIKNFTLPEKYSKVDFIDQDTDISEQSLMLNWIDKHIPKTIEMKNLLKERLRNYRISPTHLNSFIDVIYGGPLKFYETTILRFPKSRSSSGAFGDAMHGTLDWYQKRVIAKKQPSLEQAVDFFREKISGEGLGDSELELLKNRGESALKSYIDSRSSVINRTDGVSSEVNFSNEIIMLGEVSLTGKIDRIEIDEEKKEITVVDFKTGPSYDKWASKPALHKYKQQLYLYKVLIENSVRYKGYTATKGRLEFVEADENGDTNAIEIEFTDKELKQTMELLTSVWGYIKDLNFPDISSFKADLSGIRAFEKFLINNKPS